MATTQIFINVPYISGMEPAVSQRFSGFLGFIPVTLHHYRALHYYLTLLSRCKLAVVFIKNLDLGAFVLAYAAGAIFWRLF